MTTVKNYVAANWKWWTMAVSLGVLGVTMLALGGCSTVSGFAQDLGAASEGLRDAMSEE